VFVDAEFSDYEKDVLLKLPRKEYILYFSITLIFCQHGESCYYNNV